MKRRKSTTVDVQFVAHDHARVTLGCRDVFARLSYGSTFQDIMQCNKLRVMEVGVTGADIVGVYTLDAQNNMTVTRSEAPCSS